VVWRYALCAELFLVFDLFRCGLGLRCYTVCHGARRCTLHNMLGIAVASEPGVHTFQCPGDFVVVLCVTNFR
jgi:hypothetical protein